MSVEQFIMLLAVTVALCLAGILMLVIWLYERRIARLRLTDNPFGASVACHCSRQRVECDCARSIAL